jgi:hypothetical protein
MPAKSPILLAALLLSGCTVAAAPAGLAPASDAPLPPGARASPAGYLTILEVPPSPFPDEPPPEPRLVDDLARRTSSPDPAVRATAWEEANGPPAFRNELQRLGQILPREEPDNFVQMRIVRDPAVAAEVWFKRDAARTLARYTSNPLVRPRQGGASMEEQERLRALWTERMEGETVITTVGVDPLGPVQVAIAVDEAEFRRIAAQRGWSFGPEVELIFPPPRPPAFTDPALARFVRAFARESKAKGIQLTGGFSGRIVLDDGCFRLASRDAGGRGPLVLFGRQTRLGLDQHGYLAVFDAAGERRYRIGETGSWPGPNTVDEEDPDVRELRRQCGSGPVTNVAEPQSERLFSLPYPQWVADYARARAIPYRQAWKQVIACMKREEARGRSGLALRDRCIRQFN